MRAAAQYERSEMTPEQVAAHFTRADGQYHFSRWGRPIAPVIFGIDDTSLEVFKGALEAVSVLAQHPLTDVDPHIGANLMFFFISDWQELAETPKLDKMIPDLKGLVSRLETPDANQYRIFRFDDAGAIQACFAFVRMDQSLLQMAAEDLALSQMVQIILLWSETAFGQRSLLAKVADMRGVILRPEIGNLIRAAYDPGLPVSAMESAHAYRLFARLDQPE